MRTHESRKASRLAIVSVLSLAIVLVGAVYLYVVERNRIIPPPGLNTLESFERTMPPPKKLAEIDFGGAKLYVWVGQSSRWSFASGPHAIFLTPQVV